MSSKNIKEILKLCEEFIPGDPGGPPEFFFDKVADIIDNNTDNNPSAEP